MVFFCLHWSCIGAGFNRLVNFFLCEFFFLVRSLSRSKRKGQLFVVEVFVASMAMEGQQVGKVYPGDPSYQDQGVTATLPDSMQGPPTPSTQASEAPPPELPDRQPSWEEPPPETPMSGPSQLSQEVPAGQGMASQDVHVQEAAGSQPKLAEGLSSKASPAVEAFDWQALEAISKRNSYCSHCRMPVESDPKTVIRKKGHQNLQCRTCHNVVSLLYRRLDMKNFDDWKGLTPAQVETFFRKAGRCVNLQGNLDFEKIRGCLIDQISEVERHVQETKMKGKYLPLRVWKTQGYDVEAIERGADWKESDLFLAGQKKTFVLVHFQDQFFFSHCLFLLSLFSHRSGLARSMPSLCCRFLTLTLKKK